MSLNSEKLITIRQEIAEHNKRIIELQNEQEEFWKRIVKDINSNKAMYRKVEGLNGFIRALQYDNKECVIISFDENSNNPSAHGLSFVEDETGLVFKGCYGPHEFLFGL